MPKIHLKPNSAEFADTKQAERKQKVCEIPGCNEIGEHKAPKHRGLNEYYHFCLDHVREYNKAWNFFEGMNGKEVEQHIINSMYGDRPTWRYDTDAVTEDILRHRAWQTYQFSDGDLGHDRQHNQSSNGPFNANTPEFEALSIMGLQPPIDLQKIKARYKELAKKYHPDHNKGCKKSEELLKSINMAYTVLKMAYDQFQDLPDRK